MSGFIRRFTNKPSLSQIQEIEGIVIEDQAPEFPSLGTGTGTVVVVGEFEDGPFKVTTETFGSDDLIGKFGGLGYQYGGSAAQNACARRRSFELWNGNGYLRASQINARRMMICRVDSSVGEVSFSPRASLKGNIGPYAMAVGQQLSLTSSLGTASSTALAAAAATTVSSAAFTNSGYTGGEAIDIRIDNSPTIRVVFSSADQTSVQIAARINATVGATVAASVVVGAGVGVRLTGLQLGTGGRIIVSNAVGTPLAPINITAGTFAGTGTVANINAVTANEVVAIVNATVAQNAINAYAVVDADGAIRVFDSSAANGTIEVNPTPMSAVLFAPELIDVAVPQGTHPAGVIPAGTRVQTAGGVQFVTMRSISVLEGTATVPDSSSYSTPVRPAFDDGSGLGASAGTVNVVVDPISFAYYVVSNAQAISVPLTENQLDVRYQEALTATLDARNGANEEINLLVSARCTLAVTKACKQNVIDASAQGFFGRNFIGRTPLGYTQAQNDAWVESAGRAERYWNAWPQGNVQIPQIAAVGIAGGLGFTANGNIDLGNDIPLATVCSQLPPEENIGQETRLIENWSLESRAPDLKMSNYIAGKRKGIVMMKIDAKSGVVFQSSVTTSLDPARTTIERRKMADYIQDNLARIAGPYCKKLATDTRRMSCYNALDGFLNILLSPSDPERQRIAAYLLDMVSGQTPALTANGIFIYITKVRTLPAMLDIVLQTQIGPGVTTVVSEV